MRGAGAAGLAAALALARQGLRVALLGADGGAGTVADTREDVRAYALNAASVRLLGSLKVWDAIPDDARTPVHDISIVGRNTQGVRLIRLAEGERLTGIERVEGLENGEAESEAEAVGTTELAGNGVEPAGEGSSPAGGSE